MRKGIFDVTRNLVGVEGLSLPGYEVNLHKVTVWIIREMRLHGYLPNEIVFNLKIDGRPFFGMKITNDVLYIVATAICSL